MKRVIIDFTDDAWANTTIKALISGLANTDGLQVGFNAMRVQADCAFVVNAVAVNTIENKKNAHTQTA